MAIHDKQFNVNKGLSVKGTTVIDENRNVNAVALTVSSTAVVTNLNAEKVGGKTLATLGVADANSTISGAWNFTGTPSFTVGTDIAPFTVSANSATVTNLSAGKFAGLTTDGFALIGATKSITGAWTFQTGPSFTATSPLPPFTVSSNAIVTDLNADLLDGYNSAAAATASTIVLRDSSGNIAANQLIMGTTAAARNTDNVFYSSLSSDTIYKNTAAGMKASLGFLNAADLAAWTGSSNVVTLGSASAGSGTLTANRFISTVADATSTAPFTVASTTMVTNLNAEMVGGSKVTDFLVASTNFYIGTTGVPLNRPQASLAIAGITVDAAVITSGVLPVARGGTGLSATNATAGYIPYSTSSGTGMAWGAPPTAFPGFAGTGSATTASKSDHSHSEYMLAAPSTITATSFIYAGNAFKTTGTGSGNGFIVGSVTGGAGHFTTDANTTSANLLLLTGNNVYIKNIANTAFKDLYAGYIYSNNSLVSVDGHSHSIYLPKAGGTLSGELVGTSVTMSGQITTSGSGYGTTGGLKVVNSSGGVLQLNLDGTTSTANAALYIPGLFDIKNNLTTGWKGCRAATFDTMGGTGATYGFTAGGSSGTKYATYGASSTNTATIYADGGCRIYNKASSDWAQLSASELNSIHNTNVGSDLHVEGYTYHTSSVTIGTSTTNQANITIYGNASFMTSSQITSDIRLKRDIRVIDSSDALSKITQIEMLGGVIGYRLKSSPIDTSETLGVSAQVIAEVVPQATGTWTMDDDQTEYLTWKPDSITALLIASVAKLNERLTALENSIAGSI